MAEESIGKLNYTGERLIKGSRDFLFEDVYFEHIYRYCLAASYCRKLKVLDVACGTGYGSFHLSRKAKQVIGGDLEMEALCFCQRHYASSRTVFVNMDVRRLALRNQTVDCVVSFETLEHVTNHHEFLKECKRVLTPGGIVIVSTPDKESYDQTVEKNPYHLHELNAHEFRRLFNQYFEEIAFFGQGRMQEINKRHAHYKGQSPSVSVRLKGMLKKMIFANRFLFRIFPYISGKHRVFMPEPLENGIKYKYVIAVGKNRS